jgi:hypothetical protein
MDPWSFRVMPPRAALGNMPAMQIVHHHGPARDSGAGHRCSRVAGPDLGSLPAECWLHMLDPGATLAWPAAPCEQALVVIDGAGKLLFDGAPQRFVAPCTLLIPAGQTAQITNQGAIELRLIAIARLASGP